MSNTNEDIPAFARNAINLASAGLGAKPIFATDEFFAPLERMLSDEPAIFYPEKFDDNGKWMDGWETRRRRSSGHDYAVVQLAAPGTIAGFDVDTAHFTGNYPPACRIEACSTTGKPDEATLWTEVLGLSQLGASSHHYFTCSSKQVWTHVRLHIHPDGGVARLRVYGQSATPASLSLRAGASVHRRGPWGQCPFRKAASSSRKACGCIIRTGAMRTLRSCFWFTAVVIMVAAGT